MPWLDLSHPLQRQIPTYPGSPQAGTEPIAALKTHGYRENRLALNSHSGTHLDCPAHLLPEGKPLDRLPISAFTGNGLVVDAARFENEIPAEVTQTLNIETGVEFILFYTGWARFWNSPAYFSDFPYLSEELAARLARLPLKGIGFDTPSADAMRSANLPNHHLFLNAGMIILENLTNLEKLINVTFRLFCFPLNIVNGDGSPVRAAALTGND